MKTITIGDMDSATKIKALVDILYSYRDNVSTSLSDGRWTVCPTSILGVFSLNSKMTWVLAIDGPDTYVELIERDLKEKEII